MCRVRASSRSSRDWPRCWAALAPANAMPATPMRSDCRSIMQRPDVWRSPTIADEKAVWRRLLAGDDAALGRSRSRHETFVAIDRAAADDGRHDAPLHRPLVERRVLGLAPQLVAIDLPGMIRVEHHEIGRRALGEL